VSSTPVATSEIFDVVIVGGGPVGAALGALLARLRSRALRVLLLERDVPDLAQPIDARDLRVFALSRASERILRAAGAWSALAAVPGVLTPYERMHVWPRDAEPRSGGSLTFDAAELGEANLGYIVGNAALQRATLAAFIEGGGTVQRAQLDDVCFAEVGLELLTSAGRCMAKLVIGADGGGSRVREIADLGVEAQDYLQLAMVANVQSERPHEHTAF